VAHVYDFALPSDDTQDREVRRDEVDVGVNDDGGGCVEHSHLEIQKEREETLGRGNGRHAIPRRNERDERLLVCPLM
jgi:hypothetical protein